MNETPAGPAGHPPVLGVIGGSGVYGIEGLEDAQWRRVESPFGAPSDELLTGRLEGQPMVFLPRHGRGHRIPPSELNFRANIDALKRLGVTEIVSVSAVGSLREDLSARNHHSAGQPGESGTDRYLGPVRGSGASRRR